MLTPNERAVVIAVLGSYAWIPPQVKALFVEVDGRTLTVQLGCDVDDERVREARDDIGIDTHNLAGEAWDVDIEIHEHADITGWRAHGWLPVHLAAAWGTDWIGPCDELATADLPPEWTPDPAELAGPDFNVRPADLPSGTEWQLVAQLAHAAAGQITSSVAAVNMVVSTTRADVYWHLDTPPDEATARAMNVTDIRLREHCATARTLNSLQIGHRWYVSDLEPPNTTRWVSFFERDDPRTWAERDRDDASEPVE